MAKINDDIAYPILGSLGGTVRMVIYDPLSGDPLNKVLPATVEASFILNNIGGTLSIFKGGTGNTTAQSAFDALSPLTAKGDLLVSDGVNNTNLPVGADNYLLFADSSMPNGLKWMGVTAFPAALFSKIDQTIVTNTTTETSIIGSIIGTDTIAANITNIGDTYSIYMGGTIRTNGVGESIHIRVTLGGVLIADSGVISLENLNSLQVCEIELENITFRAIGVATVAETMSTGDFVYRDSANPNDPKKENMALNNTTTIDTTIDNQLDITAEWGSASVNNTINVETMTFVRIK